MPKICASAPERNHHLAAALAYAASGMPVFPCNDAKEPLVKGGFKAATTDAATIRRWWTSFPAALISIPTGEASGVWALDVDALGEHDHDGLGALAALVAEHGPLPRTRTHLSASGGRHLLFRYDPACPLTNARGKLPPGIDVRGRGGYIIAPPSRRANGTAWRIEDDAAIAEAPQWLLDILRPPERQTPPQATAGASRPRSGRTPRRSAGLYANTNAAALANLAAWAPVLFPAARYQPGTGAWRVRSRDLGEPWQEDLSIAPGGIWHFGEEAPYTPIDLVLKYGGHRTARQAALWLCARLGLDPEAIRRPVADDLPATYPRATMAPEAAREAMRRELAAFGARVQDWWRAKDAGADPGPAPVLGLAVGVGLGKTSATRALMAEMVEGGALGDRRPVLLVPRHALGREIVEAFAEMGVHAAQWRGRKADDPRRPDDKMCLDPARVADAQEAELPVEQAACRLVKGGETILCPRFNECGYQRQKADARAAQVIVAAHDLLFNERPADIGPIGFLAIDEGFHGAGLRGVEGELVEVPLDGLKAGVTCYTRGGREDIERTADLMAARGKLHRAIKASESGPIRLEHLRAAGLTASECRWAAGLERRRMRPAGLHPGMAPAERRAALQAALPADAGKGAYAKPGRCAALWSILATAIEAGHDAHGASIEPVKDKGGSHLAVVLRWRASIKEGWQAPTLHADATMQPEIVRQYLPGIEIAEPVQAKAAHMRIRQVLGAPVTAKALHPETRKGVAGALAKKCATAKLAVATDSKVESFVADTATRTGRSEREYITAANNLRKLHTFISLRAMAVRPGRLLLVAQKEVVKRLVEMGLPGNAEGIHFNGLSGLDRWRDVRAMVVIGRTLPEPGAVERLAIALTGRQPEQIPMEPGQKWAWYPDAERRIALADGGSVPIESEQHPDATAEAIRWRICEGELVQAIGRGRGVNRTSADPIEVDLLADYCLPIEVAEVAAWEDIMPDRWATTAARGAVLINAAHRSRAYPDLWETREAAKLDGPGAVGVKRLLEDLYNRQITPTAPWAHVTYQLAGERQKPAEAWFDLEQVPAPRAWLEQKLGPLAAFALVAPAEPRAAPEPVPLPPEPVQPEQVVDACPADPPPPEPPTLAIDARATALLRRHAERLGIPPERVLVLAEGERAPPRPPTALPMHIAQARARLYETGRILGLPAWRLWLDAPAESVELWPVVKGALH